MKMKNGHVLEYEQEEIGGGVEVGTRGWGLETLAALRRWEKRNGFNPQFDGGWLRSKRGRRSKHGESTGKA